VQEKEVVIKQVLEVANSSLNILFEMGKKVNIETGSPAFEAINQSIRKFLQATDVDNENISYDAEKIEAVRINRDFLYVTAFNPTYIPEHYAGAKNFLVNEVAGNFDVV
jgi:hypothetical protein